MGEELIKDAWQVVNTETEKKGSSFESLLMLYASHSNMLQQNIDSILNVEDDNLNHRLELFTETKKIFAEMIADKILEDNGYKKMPGGKYWELNG